MQKTLVKYRTTGYLYNRYAVVPTSYISDLQHWLTLSECAEIVSMTDNEDGGYILPINWPSYRNCLNCIRFSDIRKQFVTMANTADNTRGNNNVW